MYEEKKVSENKSNLIAQEMSDAICKFSPQEQNEIVRIIYNTVHENRQAKIDEAEKSFIHLKDTLVQLQGRENKVN
jgi:hypothetical protein